MGAHQNEHHRSFDAKLAVLRLSKCPAAEVNSGQEDSRNLTGTASVAAASLWLIQSPSALKGYKKDNL